MVPQLAPTLSMQAFVSAAQQMEIQIEGTATANAKTAAGLDADPSLAADLDMVVKQ